MFSPKIYADSTVLRTPLRFFIQTNIADSLSSATEIILKQSGSSTSTWELQSGKNLACLIKEYNPGTKRAFKIFSTKCDWIDVSDSRKGISIKTPTLHNFIDTLLYEITITSDQPDPTSGFGFTNTQLSYDIEVMVKYPTDQYYHYVKKRHYYYQKDQIQINGFYQTQEQSTVDTEFYLQFTLIEEITPSTSFPISYIELIFDGYQISNVNEYSYGDEIDCGIEYFNVTRSGSGTPPGKALLDHYGPKCHISEDQDRRLLVRVEWIEEFVANGQLNIAIHSIKIPAKSNQDLSVQYPVSVFINYYTKSGIDFIKRQKQFYQVFIIDWKSAFSSSVSHSLSSEYLEPPSSVIQYENGQIYKINIGNWPVSTRSYASTASLTTTKQNFGSKFLVNLGKSDYGGPLNVGQNYLENLQFEDYNSVTSSTFVYWDSSNDKLLWKNTRLNTVVFSNQNSRTSSSVNYEFRIKNINNPKTTEYDKYFSEIYTPKVQMKFFENYQLQKYIQSIKYLQGFWPQDSAQSFYFEPSISNVIIDSINVVGQTGWVQSEFLRLQIVIDLSGLNSINEINEQMEVLEIIFLQGINDIMIDSCHFLYESSNYFGICNIQKSVDDQAESQQYTAVQIHGLRDFDTVGMLEIYVWAQINNGVESGIRYRHKIYDWKSEVVGIDHFPGSGTYQTVVITQSSSTSYQNIIPSLFSEKYLKWYQELLETDLTEDGTFTEYLQFIMEIPDDLNSDSHVLEIELPSLIIDQYIPNNSDLYERIKCYWLPVLEKHTLIGYPSFAQNCFFTSSQDPYSYTIAKPQENLPAGTYLLKIHFEKQDLYTSQPKFLLASPPQITELLISLQTSLKFYSDIGNLNQRYYFFS